MTLQNALVLCGGGVTDETARARADNPGQPEANVVACQLLQDGARLLQELHQQITRSETQHRLRLSRAKKNMGLQLKEIQDTLLKASSFDEATRSEKTNELKLAKEKADQDCARLLAELRLSEGMLAQLEVQLKHAIEQLEDADSRLAASAQENRVLLDEVQRLGNKQHPTPRGEVGTYNPGDNVEKEVMRETIKRQDERMDQLRSEISKPCLFFSCFCEINQRLLGT